MKWLQSRDKVDAARAVAVERLEENAPKFN